MIESLLTMVIREILKGAGGSAWQRASRHDKVLKVLDAVGLKPGAPEPNFGSVYAHTLVEYGVEKPGLILEFFRYPDIRKAFKESFERNDFAILNHEAAHLIEWNKIGDELRQRTLDPRLEFARFTLVFNEMVDRTRSPAETRRDHKIEKILKIVEEGSLQEIRVKNIEKIQGTLAEQIEEWFKTLGYHFESHDIQTDEYCEWIIRIPARRGYDSILVRYIESQAEVQDLENVKSAAEEHGTDEGWLVAAHRKSPGACDMADKEKTIFCFTFDELLDEKADFDNYFNWLERFVRERSIETNYVPLACKRELYDQNTGEKEGDEQIGKEEGWIEGYIDRWLEDPCKEHISILGEFGTGKTWFTHHYAFQIMRKYLEAKERGLRRPRLPLVIQLRDYSKALSSESLFSDFFFRKHEIPLPGYSAFEQLNRMGRLLLIFDGFDEMADKLDRQKMINNFWELARIVVPGAKAILTCRSEHFPNAIEGRALLNAELQACTRRLTGDPPQFEILELEKFDEGQIREALSLRTDRNTTNIVMSHAELLDLASRPVMLEFILEALPDIEAGKPIDLSRVYLYAIRAKLERDIKAERTFTSMADKLYFMCELSWEMLTTEKMSLNYRLFPDRLANLFGPIVSDQKDLDHWHYDMMGNNLLIRNDEGDYTPAHRSLLEFFVVYKALAHLGMLPDDFTEPARGQANVDDGKASTDYTWTSYFRRELDEDGAIRPILPLRRFRAENVSPMLESLGGMSAAVFRFVHEITNVEEVRFAFHELLSEVLKTFKRGDRNPEEEQQIISFILRFRALSQEWEERSGQGDAIRRFWRERLEIETSTEESKARTETMVLESAQAGPIEIEMVQFPLGSFLMGDEGDGPIHRVHIARPSMIGTVLVTQKLYREITGETPGRFKGDKLPVERVSWYDAAEFCNALSRRMNLEPAYRIEDDEVAWDLESSGFRLPTEAEWEYACRAGSTSRYASGDLESDLDVVGWYAKNSDARTHPVREKSPNPWGIFDMHGNVWEWVWDLYRQYSSSQVSDPTGPISRGSGRVTRGGSWGYLARECRSACRVSIHPGNRISDLGFRLSRSVSPSS